MRNRICHPENEACDFPGIYRKDKTTLLMPLPNFALMINQKFFPRSKNTIECIYLGVF